MSLGSIIGGVVGAVAGFFIGGPMGAVYGASIGFGIGSFVDPMTPDMPSTGAPAPEQAAMKSTVGDPVPDLAGTAKIVGHLLAYGAERSVAIYSEPASSGGKGGAPEPQAQVVGYNYYMSWVLGFCKGPANTLYAIYKNTNELIWEGTLDNPASGGKETISVEGFGSVDFYFGTDDQVANTKVGAILDDDTLNSPMRNFVWCFCDDCLIGNYPRTPSLSIVIKKLPEYSWSLEHEIQDYDCNPMHAIYYTLNGLCGLPTSWLNDTTFNEVARILAIEYRGISMLFADERSTLDYVQSINSHIDGILRYGTEGEFSPILIRDDYDADTIPVIDEDDMMDEPSLVRPSWIDSVNEVKIQYSEIFNVTRSKALDGPIWGTGYNSSEQWGSVAPDSSVFVLGSQMQFETIIAGNSFSIGMDRYGTPYVTGSNQQGCFGFGNLNDAEEFTLWGSGQGWNFVKMSCSPWGLTIAGIRSDGAVVCAGYNLTGILAINNTTSPQTSLQLSGYIGPEPGAIFTQPFYVSDLATGNMHQLAIRTDGNLYACGNKSGGALGSGTTSTSYQTQFKPCYIWNGMAYEIVTGSKVWCGWQTSYVLRGSGLWGCGNNQKGQLGIGDTTDRSRFRTLNISCSDLGVGFEHAVALSGGALYATGLNTSGQLGQGDKVNRDTWTQIGTDTDWVAVNCGSHHTTAMKANGVVYTCGEGTGGRLGLNTTSDVTTLTEVTGINFYQVSGGNAFTLGIKS